MSDEQEEVPGTGQVSEPQEQAQTQDNQIADESSEAETPETGQDESQEGDQEQDAQQDEGEEQDEKPKRLSRSQRLQRKLAALQAQVSQPQSNYQQPEAQKQETEARPKESDYQDWAEYQADLAAYKVRESLNAEKQAEAKAQQEQQQHLYSQVLEEDYAEQEAEARKSLPDYDAVVNAGFHSGALKLGPVVAQLIGESEKGALVTYHLAKNPEKAREIARLNPVQAAREIGRLEAVLSSPKPRTATPAPKMTKVTGGGTPPTKTVKDLDKVSYAEYKRLRRAGVGD